LYELGAAVGMLGRVDEAIGDLSKAIELNADYAEAMTKAEIEEIADFIMDTFEGVCEVDPPTTMQLQLSELYRIIPLLMDETFKTKERPRAKGATCLFGIQGP